MRPIPAETGNGTPPHFVFSCHLKGLCQTALFPCFFCQNAKSFDQTIESDKKFMYSLIIIHLQIHVKTSN
jgi:hypothetical protein